MKGLAAAALLHLLLVSSILAATPPIVTEALEAMDNDDRNWTFVQTTLDSGNGKALLLKSLNQDTVTTFSEYRKVVATR